LIPSDGVTAASARWAAILRFIVFFTVDTKLSHTRIENIAFMESLERDAEYIRSAAQDHIYPQILMSILGLLLAMSSL
jgi:hypothetical protein